MLTKRLLLASIASSWAWCGAAIGQECSHANGQWADNYGMVWYLTQNSTSIVGSVYTNYLCGAPFWSVDGSLYSGSLDLFAVNPNWSDICALYFEYSGGVSKGGCNVASGSWYNDYGYMGAFVMSKTCEIPPYETTSSTGAGWQGPHYVFDVNIANGSGGDLSGRKYRETNYAPGYDSCHYPTSPITPFVSVTNLNPFYLFSNNHYTDSIGWGDAGIRHYRSHGDAPCDTHIYQQMQIACGVDGAETYHAVQNNILIAEIGITTVTSTRDGVPHGPQPYTPPP